MSCSLYWKPVSKKSYRCGQIQLREILNRKFGYPSILTRGDLNYLQALVDANVDGALELIAAIQTYDAVEIYLEC